MSIKMDGICCVVVACVPQFLASPFARSFEYHCRGAGGRAGIGEGGVGMCSRRLTVLVFPQPAPISWLPTGWAGGSDERLELGGKKQQGISPSLLEEASQVVEKSCPLLLLLPTQPLHPWGMSVFLLLRIF